MKTMPLLAGKVAVVTGASRAVGAGMAAAWRAGCDRLRDGTNDGLQGWDNSRNAH